MRKQLLTAALLFLATALNAQISSTITSQDATCWYSNDGSMSIDSITGCFAPVELTVDSTTYVIDHLKNDGYTHINHGSGTGEDRSYSVWAGSTSLGDVYIATGTFENSVTIDGTTLSGNGLLDMYTVCFDANTSQVLWALTGSTPGNTYTAGYAITGAGDKAYVTGYFTGTCTIGNFSLSVPGGGILDYQAYVAKIDIPTGNVDTVVQYGHTAVQEGFNIHCKAGRLYFGGNFQDSITIAGTTHTSLGGLDAFVACIDTNMSTEYWSASGVGSGDVKFFDIVAQENAGTVEKVFLVGEYVGDATFGNTSLTPIGSNDFYIAAVDTTGTWLWAISGGSTNPDYCTTIDINSTGDRLYVGGSWSGTMNFAGSAYTSSLADDGFIAYLDTAGNVDTLYAFVGDGVETVKDLQSVDDDFLVFTASMNSNLTYADSSYSTNGGVDGFVGKIGEGFHEIWGKNFGGSAEDQYSSVRTGPNDRLHVAGFFQNDASAYQAGLISGGNFDLLVTNDLLMGIADTSILLSGLMPGTYPVSYVDSAGNMLTENVVIGPDTLSLNQIVVNASSGTANDGSIDLTVTGGTPGYAFSWSNGAITEDLDSLTAGVYCVTITDTNGCVDSSHCFNIDSVATGGALIVTVTGQNVDCFGDTTGSINLTVSGGVPPYAYNWSNGETSQDLAGLGAGTYSVTVTDNDTSVYINSFVISEPPQILITGVVTPPSSGTSNDGGVDITVTGGIPVYTFSWSNGETTEDIDSLVIGSYTLTVTDSAGCTAIQSFAVDTIPALSLVSTASDVTCIGNNNGSIDLTVIGGVSPFVYAWSNGATAEDIFGLSAGSYTVTVTDSTGQTATLTDDIDSNPIFPAPTVGPISGGNSVQAWSNYNYSVPSSNGSSFAWDVTGGVLVSAASNAAIVQWNAGPNGSLLVTETDNNGCIGQDSLSVSILFVGVGENGEHAITLVPNPVQRELFIQLPPALDLPKLVIRNVHGQLVWNAPVNAYSETIDLENLSTGSYILEIHYDDLGVMLTHKFIKQ